MAGGSKTSIYISRALRRCRQLSSSEDERLDSEQIMTLLERKLLLNSSRSTCNINGHTWWSVFMDFYMIIWQLLCVLEVLKWPIFEDRLFAFLPQHHLRNVCMLPSTHSNQVVAQTTSWSHQSPKILCTMTHQYTMRTNETGFDEQKQAFFRTGRL